MNNDNTRDAAQPSPATAGSQPVAFAVFDGHDRMHLAPGYSEAESCAEDIGGEIVPLYRKPTLTDEELEALDFMLRHAAWAASERAFADSGDYRLHHDAVFRIMGR
jgi:hypothetical protein